MLYPAQPRREHQPGGANLQDLRRAGDREGAEHPYMLAKDIYGIGFALRTSSREGGIPRDSSTGEAGVDQAAGSDLGRSLRLATREAQARGGEAVEVPEPISSRRCRKMLTGGSLLLEEIDGEPLISCRISGGGGRHRGKDQRLARTAKVYRRMISKGGRMVERRTGKTLAPSQREALKRV